MREIDAAQLLSITVDTVFRDIDNGFSSMIIFEILLPFYQFSKDFKDIYIKRSAWAFDSQNSKTTKILL